MQIISSRLFSQAELRKISNTLDSWKNKIKSNDNLSFIKFGDGEFLCMDGKVGKNCDHHSYSRELGDKLYDAWFYFNTLNNVYINSWVGHKPEAGINSPSARFQEELVKKTKKLRVKFVPQEILLQNTLSESKFNLFKTVKYSNRKKIFIGPARLFAVKNFLNIDKLIKIPLINSFSEYDEILKNAVSEIEDNCIFLLSAGMPAKSIIHKLIEKNKNITCLDIGSGFDSLFAGITREGQLDSQTLKKYYTNL